MHQSRAQVSKKVPVERKGTQFVARPLTHKKDSIPVVIAVRDMLKLARTTKEVKRMIHQKLLKINGREVKDYRDSIRLLNLFEAEKTYFLTLTPTGKFMLEETKQKERPCKVINKTILSKNKIQLNCHDGTNILSDDKKIKTSDTIYIDLENKIKKHVQFEKGKECLVIRGRFLGQKGKIEQTKENKIMVKIKDLDRETNLDKEGVIVL